MLPINADLVLLRSKNVESIQVLIFLQQKTKKCNPIKKLKIFLRLRGLKNCNFKTTGLVNINLTLSNNFQELISH